MNSPPYKIPPEDQKALRLLDLEARSAACPAAVPLGPDGVPWTLPAPLTAGRDRPAFPVDALPAALAAYLRGLATELQVPFALPALLALPVLSVAAPRASVAVDTAWKEPHLGTYVLVFLPSGDRKSAVFSKMTAFLLERERAQRIEMEQEVTRARTRALLAKKAYERSMNTGKANTFDIEELALAHARAEAEIPVLPRYYVGDCTPEKLAEMMPGQAGRMALLSAEPGVLDVVMGSYSKSASMNLDILLKGYSGDVIRVDRMGRDSNMIDAPQLSVGVTAQPSVLAKIGASLELRGRGLLARFFLVSPESLVGHREVSPAPLLPETTAAYESILGDLLRARWCQEGTEDLKLRLSEAARAHLSEFREELEPRMASSTGDLAWITDWVSKLPGGVVRIAGLFHLVEHTDGQSSVVAESTMLAAIRIGRYLLAHAQAAFAAMGEEPETGAAERLLPCVERGPSQSSVRDLYQSAKKRSGFGKTAEVEAALEVLAEYDYVRLIPRIAEGPGRPRSPKYVVNPRLKTPNNPTTI